MEPTGRRHWLQVTMVSKAAGAEWNTLSDKAGAGFARAKRRQSAVTG